MILFPYAFTAHWSIVKKTSTTSIHLSTVAPSHLAFLPVAQVLKLKTILYICTLALTLSHLLKEFAPSTLFFLSYMVNFSFIISIILKQMYKHEKKISWPHFLPQVLLTDFVAENLEKIGLYLLSLTPLLPLFLKHISNFGSIISLKLLFARHLESSCC